VKKISVIIWEFYLLLLTLILFLSFANKGLVVGDEGYILNAAWRFSQGQIPYKDFWILYPPGIVFLLGSLFSIFGKSILLGRYLIVSIGVLISFLFLKISRKVIKPPLHLLPSIMFIFWGTMQLNFPWPTWFCWVSCLLSLYFLLLFSEKKQNYWLFISGIFAGLAFLFKQTVGFSVIFSLLIISGNLLALLGILIPLIFTFLYLICNQAFLPFWQIVFADLNTYNKQGTMWTDLPNISFSFFGFAKGFFYYFPFLFFLGSGFYLLKKNYLKNKKIQAVFIFTFLFYLSGIVPTIDLLHNSLVFPAIFILLMLVLSKTKNILVRSFLIIAVFMIIGLGIYKLFFKNYAGFESPIIKQSIPQTYINERLFVDKRALELIPVTNYIKKKTNPGDKIFVYYYAPIIYFLSGRENASRYPQIVPGFLNLKQQTEIINDLKNVNVIILQQAMANKDFKAAKLGLYDLSLLYDYLIDNFTFSQQFTDYQIRIR